MRTLVLQRINSSTAITDSPESRTTLLQFVEASPSDPMQTMHGVTSLNLNVTTAEAAFYTLGQSYTLDLQPIINPEGE